MNSLQRNCGILLLVWVATLTLISACGLNPQPEPPLQQPSMGGPTAGGLGGESGGSAGMGGAGAQTSNDGSQDAGAGAIPPAARDEDAGVVDAGSSDAAAPAQP